MTLNFASGSFSLHWNRETHENEVLMELTKPEHKEQAQDVFFTRWAHSFLFLLAMTEFT